MTSRIILSGFGGQGVLSAGTMIGEAGMAQGLKSTFYPSYGAEMRGGTANCHVILSDGPIASPVISSNADILIALNKPSLDKFLPRTKEDGLVLLNTSVVREAVDTGKRTVIRMPVEELALEKIGNPRMANVILLGALAKATGLLKLDELKKSIAEKFKKKGDQVVQLNWKALELGYQY